MASLNAALSQARHAFFGWRIVVLMLGPRAAGTSVYVVGNTLFVLPMEQDLGISRGTTALLFAAGSMVGGISAPISGVVMDKLGPRRVLLASIGVMAAGYVLLSTAQNPAQVFIYFLLFISPVALNVAFNASIAFVNNWFHARKAMAMVALQVGSGLGVTAVVPLMALTISAWGWRPAALVAAGAVVVLGLPPALLSRNTPEEMGMAPDGATHAAHGLPGVGSGLTAREAMHTPAFWLIAASGLCLGGAFSGLGIHFVPIMVWKGVDEVRSAFLLTMMSFGSVPAMPVMGWAADRFGRLGTPVAVSLVTAAALAIVTLATAEWHLWVGVVLASGSLGMYPLLWAVVGHTFGRRAFSTIRGYVMAGQIAGTLGVPFGAGLLFDATGGYTHALWFIVGLWIAAAVLLMLTPRRSYVSR